MAMYLLIVFILIFINSMFRGQSKIVLFLTQCILIIMFGYMSIYNTPQDSVIYQGYYLHPEWESISPFEHGFMQLMAFSRGLGLSYLQFRLMIAFLGYGLILITLYRLKVTNKSLFYFFYILMPFVEDPIQIRNFLMASLVLLGLSFLVNEKFWGWIVYVAIVLVSSTIQSLGSLFLLIVPFYIFKNTDKIRKVYLFGSIFLGIIFAVPITRKLFSSLFGGFFQHFGNIGQKISVFLYRAQPGLIIFSDILIIIVLFFLMNLMKKLILSKEDIRTSKLINLGINLTYTLCATVPLYFFAYNFDRMVKDSLFFFFIIFAVVIPKIRTINIKQGFLVFVMIFVTISGYSISYYSYGVGGRWSPVVYPVIFDNQFGKEFSDYK